MCVNAAPSLIFLLRCFPLAPGTSLLKSPFRTESSLWGIFIAFQREVCSQLSLIPRGAVSFGSLHGVFVPLTVLKTCPFRLPPEKGQCPQTFLLPPMCCCSPDGVSPTLIFKFREDPLWSLTAPYPSVCGRFPFSDPIDFSTPLACSLRLLPWGPAGLLRYSATPLSCLLWLPLHSDSPAIFSPSGAILPFYGQVPNPLPKSAGEVARDAQMCPGIARGPEIFRGSSPTPSNVQRK